MLQEKIAKDYIQAMKDKNTLRSSTLSFLRAQIKNLMIDQKVDSLEDKDIIVVLKKQVKQRQDSIEQFEKANRSELADKEKDELAILKEYLPEEMSQDQVAQLVVQCIEEVGASGMKDMGAVMKAVVEKAAGRADNKIVSQLVKEKLSQL